MAATISVLAQMHLKVTKTYSGAEASNPDVLFNTPNLDDTYNSGTAVPVTKHAQFDLTLSGGAGSIDLTALPGDSADETVDGTGLKLQALVIQGKSDNANPITITKGASNGYGLDAAGASWTAVLDAGQMQMFFGNESSPNIASGAKIFDVTGTGSQVLHVHVVMG